MVLFINTKFPKSQKNYESKALENTSRLKDLMEKLIIDEQQVDAKPVVASVLKPKPSGGQVWSYSDRKKKPKTFALK